jgi:hypothetical protein
MGLNKMKGPEDKDFTHHIYTSFEGIKVTTELSIFYTTIVPFRGSEKEIEEAKAKNLVKLREAVDFDLLHKTEEDSNA